MGDEVPRTVWEDTVRAPIRAAVVACAVPLALLGASPAGERPGGAAAERGARPDGGVVEGGAVSGVPSGRVAVVDADSVFGSPTDVFGD
ncbi:hypothetical protein HW445_11885 [Streptomyces sp. UH6]|nr:hypothetical protein [Streptomyces sp. UH6]